MADQLRTGEWKSFRLEVGQSLVVRALAPSCAAELIAHVADEPRERLSTLVTGLAENVHQPATGTRFWSQNYKSLFRITDQSHGHHDISLEACNPGLLSCLYSSDRPTCFENFRGALAGCGLGEKWVPYPLGIFRRCGQGEDGFTLLEPASVPGDFLALEAETPLLILISACPLGAPAGSNDPTIRVEVS